uniref:ETAA1 activator of ATR kinase a n=1 Tax=Salmo trutta TaxID=8032 RepID=A0A674DWL2_SALTR
MTEWRKYCDTSASGMTAGSDESQQGGGKPKTNRLRRSLKQTQKPTRVTRSRYNNVFNKGESPMNESELQQDIVWDATSPSPLRTGKKNSANVGIVDISEIVNRIAPKVGNTLAKSSLLQWIGDSAIPCTPEMQQPRAKKKSPRTNGVDDLLKLAKQFDFNMFRQDEERNQPPPLLSSVTPESTQSALKTNSMRNSKDQIPPDHEMEDDLDFLFDGPTQHISLNLSQNSLPQSLEVKTAPTVSSANNNFDDDWEKDILLDDSLVFEMTQNPDLFAAPNHCSTQRGSNETKRENNNPSAISKNALQGSRDIKPAVSKGQNETVKNRKTFTLEANPNVQAKSILSEALPKVGNVPDTVKPAPHRNAQQNQPSLFPIKAPSMESSYQLSHTSTFTNSYSMWPLQVENSSYHKPTENNNMKGTGIIKDLASHSVFPEDDLDSLFASDSIWDDKDDDLLCQACDSLEGQVQSMEDPVITRSQSLPSNQTERQKFVPVSAPLNSTGEGPYESTRVKSTCVAGSTANQQGTGSGARPSSFPSPVNVTETRAQFTFKRPSGCASNPVIPVTNKAAGKCSVVEIELKKQQAMERRRQRMQTAHNLRAPT